MNASEALATMDAPNLKLADYFINRELSQLEFNRRVLEQAKDPAIPPLERLKFLCISSTNLDEFFEIRVAGLKQRLEVSAAPAGPDGLPPSEVLRRIHDITTELVAEQYRVLNDELIPALRHEGIRFVRRDEWTDAQRAWLEQSFHAEIVPVLSPTTLDPTRPIPRILNKSLNFIVALHGRDAFGRPVHRAIVQAPRSLPRLIQLPAELVASGESQFVFLSSIIHAFVDQLFAGMDIEGCYQFRVTRNSDLYVDDEDVDDLMRALEGELFESRYGAAVRLETAQECSDELADYLLNHFQLSSADLYRVPGPVNLNRLLAVYDLIDRPDLKYPPFTPGIPKALVTSGLFDAIARQDILLHHPYESFSPVADFVYRAANDPDVLAIKMTLYRTTPELTLVVRRERGTLRRYVHLGTGNYHPRTARAYTDYGLFTAHEQFGEDVHDVFMQLTSLMRTRELKVLSQSPFNLHQRLLELIRRETRHAAAGRGGRIIAKLNALVEPEIIRALYEASIAGVDIDLIVRGICCLRPDIEGVSQNIRVRSIIGRFLEHSRCYYFHNAGHSELYCASADWMDRNFFRRIEVMFPILDPRVKRRILADLDICLADNTQAWRLQANGRYRLLKPHGDEPAVAAQLRLLAELAEAFEP